MRRIPRLPRPIDLAAAPAPRPCRACAFFSTTPAPRDARPSTTTTDTSKPFTERLRSKIWGTEYAPGREDPYSRDSPLRDPATAPAPKRPQRQQQQTEGPRRQLRQTQNAYVPATTWHGLEWVGGEAWAKEQEQVPPFRGFIPEQKLSGNSDVAAALKRALVEVFTARKDGVPLEALYDSVEDATLNVVLRAAEDGSPVLEEKTVEHQTASNGDAPEAISIRSEEVKAWRPVSLRDPEIKFAVVKRVMQLTGIRIPDPAIAESDTAGILLSKITARPEPKKLADKLKRDQALTKLPNVKISSRRVTPIDKEQEVGRWKVIEQKLLDRNLPVVGHEI